MTAALNKAVPADDIERLRAEIERLDSDLVALISRRVRVAERIAAVKASAGMPILDPPQEAAVVRRAAMLARQAGLPEEDVRHIAWAIIGLTRRVENGT